MVKKKHDKKKITIEIVFLIVLAIGISYLVTSTDLLSLVTPQELIYELILPPGSIPIDTQIPITLKITNNTNETITDTANFSMDDRGLFSRPYSVVAGQTTTVTGNALFIAGEQGLRTITVKSKSIEGIATSIEKEIGDIPTPIPPTPKPTIKPTPIITPTPQPTAKPPTPQLGIIEQILSFFVGIGEFFTELIFK